MAVDTANLTLGNLQGSASAVPSSLPIHRAAYRADIDGLRAVAVLAVFAYHLGVIALKGGFVGVDIFFVISGYLIGAIVLENVQSGKPFLAQFYLRRIRRIFPALLAMILICSALSYLTLFPAELTDFGKSAIAAAFSYSNIYFFMTRGYFAPDADTVPLLHTWSLGVEEQFYLGFPLLLVIVKRYWPRHLVFGIIIIATASFLYCAVVVFSRPEVAFYLPHPRMWEMLIGTIVACFPRSLMLNRALRELVAGSGLLMIAASVALLSNNVPFPGMAALPPTVGAAMIIAAGQSGPSVASSLLSIQPVRFTGLISYSLYLWHWPIIVFHHIHPAIVPDSPRLSSRLAIFAFAFLVATLSWKFVEQPARRSRRLGTSPATLTFGIAGLSAIAAISLAVLINGGYPDRYSTAALRYTKYTHSDLSFFRRGSCFIEPPFTVADFDQQACLPWSANRKNYLLIGDSHAAQLQHALATRFNSINFLQLTAAGCPPFLSPRSITTETCRTLMDFAFSDYLVHHHVDRLILAGRWVPGDPIKLEDVLKWASSRSVPVTLFGPMLEYDQSLPRLLVKAADNGDAGLVERHRKDQSELDEQLRSLAERYHASYISIGDRICGAGRCSVLLPDGDPIMFDSNHFTDEGATYFVTKMVRSEEFGFR